MRIITAALLVFYIMSHNAHAATVWTDAFDSYADMNAVSAVWGGAKSSIALESGSQCYGGSGKCMKWTYASGNTGTTAHEFTRSVSSGSMSDIYIQARFKVVRNADAEPRGACKFIKMFGTITSGTDYANSTLNLGGVSDTYPTLHGVNYGDGSGLQNDTNREAYLYTNTHSDQDSLIEYYTQTTEFTPTENTWYTVVVRVKYNTDGNYDGETEVWIDGTERMHAYNMRNRNDGNSNIWDHISLGDYGNSYADMLLYMDDVTVSSTTPIGDETATPTGSLRSGVSAAGVTFR
jgi:hypothetical protein